MQLRLNFGKLYESIIKMGAKIQHYDLKLKKPDPLQQIIIDLETEGIEVDLEDIEVNSGGLITYESHHVILYIQDHGVYVTHSLNGQSGYKFHIADCDKLDEMKIQGRFQRYKVSSNKSGQFLVTGYSGGRQIEGYAKLRVCKLCLRKLNYNGYNHKSKFDRETIVDKFDIGSFFSKYSSFFKEYPNSSDDSPKSSYGENWHEISIRYREKIGWTCEQCRVYLGEGNHKKLLHVHHLNGVKSDHREENLKALCKDCHSKQALHNHIFVSRSDRQLIASLRNKQSEKAKSGTNANAWDEVFELADPAMEGLLDMCRRKRWPQPIPGYEVYIDGRVRCHQPLELAWEAQKVGVVIDKNDYNDCNIEQYGWKLFSLNEAMNWF